MKAIPNNGGRGDADLVQHISKRYGVAAARRWQRPPLILTGQTLKKIFELHKDSRDGEFREKDVAEFWSEYATNTPWEDVVLAIGGEPGGSEPSQTFTRVRRFAGEEDLLLNSPWHAAKKSELRECLDSNRVVAVCDTFVLMPFNQWVVLSSLVLPDSRQAYVCGGWTRAECLETEHLTRVMAEMLHNAHHIAVVALSYVNTNTARPVEVRPGKTPSPKQRREGERRPWTRRDLPWCVLLKPEDAPRYGSPGAPASARQGTPKTPHGRRGHWRHLRDGSKVFIRPCWIGPACWNAQGRVYRVLGHEADAAADAARPNQQQTGV